MYCRVELLTNVLERVQGEISSAQKFKEVMSEARERVSEYRQRLVDNGDMYYAQNFADA